MPAAYKVFWRRVLVGAVLGALWIQWGSAWARRALLGPPAIDNAQRTAAHFTALVLPRVTKSPEPHTISRADLEALLRGLKKEGYTTISLEDVRSLYFDRRPLPDKSILLGLDRDEPESVFHADNVLRRLRMRGAVFLAPGDRTKGRYKRHWLSHHDMDQLRLSGTWLFGQAYAPEADRPADQFAYAAPQGELRFFAAKSGFNDDRQEPMTLNVLPVRGDRGAQEILFTILADQPRITAFADDFREPRPKRDWVIGWGASSTARRKLVLVPTPRGTSASVFLSGTEGWRDLSLEFELDRFKKGFWAYARFKDAAHYVRIGVTGGYWTLQQRTGPNTSPVLLGRVPLKPDALPAKVRLVVKGDAVLLYINGALQFGRPLRLDPAVDRGRLQLEVFDTELRQAMAAVSSVKARPLPLRWLALRGSDISEAGVMDQLRAEAAESSVVSPSWVKVSAEGDVSPFERDRDLLWTFAGYYRCRVMPMVDLSAWAPPARGNQAGILRLATALGEQAKAWGVDGLNLLLPKAPGEPQTRLLDALRGKLKSEQRELWVTPLGPADPAWVGRVDGILKTAGRPSPGIEILEASWR